MRLEAFEAALHYYEAGCVVCPLDMDVAELVDACDYLLIPTTAKTISCRNVGSSCVEPKLDAILGAVHAYLR